MIDNYLSCNIVGRINMYLLYPEKLKDVFINDKETINEMEQLLFEVLQSKILSYDDYIDDNCIRNDLEEYGIELRYYDKYQMLLLNIKHKGLWDIDRLLNENKNLTEFDVERIYFNKLGHLFYETYKYFKMKYDIELYQVGRSGGYVGFKLNDLQVYDINKELLKDYIHKFIIDISRIKKVMSEYNKDVDSDIDPIEYIGNVMTDELVSNTFDGITIDNKLRIISSKIKTLFNELRNKVNEAVEELNQLYNELSEGRYEY